MKYLALLIFALAACSNDPEPVVKVNRIQSRLRAADDKISKTPLPISYPVKGNELMVMEIPVKNSLGFVDTHRCFVWRDKEFKNTTMSCGQDAAVDFSN